MPATAASNIRPDAGAWPLYEEIGADCVSLAQDMHGNVWCGSDGALACTDGRKCRRFGLSDGIPAGLVRRLAVDIADRVWFSVAPTEPSGPGWLGVMADGRAGVFGEADGWNGVPVTSIAAAPSGGVWIGTTGGLRYFDGRRFRVYTDADGMPRDRITALMVARDGTLWIGTDSGLTQMRGDAFRHLAGLPTRAVKALAEDPAGRLWVGTADGLLRHDGRTWTAFAAPQGLTTIPAETVRVDTTGRVWTGNEAGVGACCFDGESFMSVTTAHGLPHDNVADILSDTEGGVLFACRCGGVARLDIFGIRRISELPVPEASTRSRDDTVWWASGRQVIRQTGSDVRPLLTVPDNVTALHADSRGRLWIGTASRLWLLADATGAGTPHEVRFIADDSPGAIRSLGEDRVGTIWIGTEIQGLFFHDDNEGVAVPSTDPSGRPGTTYLLHDRTGRLWTSGRGETSGLLSYDGLQHRRYTTADGLSGNPIACLFEDRSGILWAGTDGGLLAFDGATFRKYTMEDGLAGRFVSRIVQDSRGQLWIAFLGGGISRFDGRNFQALTTEDGLPSDRVTGMLEAADGTMTLTTYCGVCRYVPDHSTPPRATLDGVEADRLYRPDEPVRVPADVPMVRIRFHGVSLRTRRMRYAYILEGADADWRATWEEEARYERLRPGEYTFRVVAINRDLVYSDPAAVLRIEIVADTREHRVRQLDRQVRGLRGLLPMCSRCKRIRNEHGEWEQLEVFISDRSRADFSHSYCPHCATNAVRSVRGQQATP